MANGKYLDRTGMSILWERIQRLVYECAGKRVVTYRLTIEDNVVTLVGSDGSRSSVTVPAVAECE